RPYARAHAFKPMNAARLAGGGCLGWGSSDGYTIGDGCRGIDCAFGRSHRNDQVACRGLSRRASQHWWLRPSASERTPTNGAQSFVARPFVIEALQDALGSTNADDERAVDC